MMSMAIYPWRFGLCGKARGIWSFAVGPRNCTMADAYRSVLAVTFARSPSAVYISSSMLLTITTTHQPASDLGHLLRKHPEKVHVFEQSFGKVHVFFPEASNERCT